jgi:hypothetical protein
LWRRQNINSQYHPDTSEAVSSATVDRAAKIFGKLIELNLNLEDLANKKSFSLFAAVSLLRHQKI